MPIFFAKIEDSKLHLQNKDAFDLFLAKVKDCPRVIVSIKKERKTRSNDHNRYYWGYVLTEIAKESGHSTEELHEALKIQFLPKRFIKVGGKELETERRTRTLPTNEFGEFIEKVKSLGSQMFNIIWIDREGFESL
jgi:hypothetical protein